MNQKTEIKRWRIGGVKEFLNLSKKELFLIDIKIALNKAKNLLFKPFK